MQWWDSTATYSHLAHPTCGHIDALSGGCSLEGVMKPRFNIDVHSLYPRSFLFLDLAHLLPLEVSI